MSDGPDPGAIIASIFLIVCGLCLAFVGGGCSIWLLDGIFSYGTEGGFMLILLAVSLLTLAGGAAMIWAATRLLRRRDG